MKKIFYVVLGGWSYEGYDEPIGIYSTMKKAEKAKAARVGYYDHTKIVEYKLDEVHES